MSADANSSEVAGAILEGLVVRVDHLGIAVSDIDEASRPWTELLGCPIVDREVVSAQNVEVGWLRFPGQDTALELIKSQGNAGLDKFQAKRGNAMHHVAVSVTDIHEAVRRIAAAGLRLIDEKPRPGAMGHLVAFIHPASMSGILVELVQDSGGAH